MSRHLKVGLFLLTVGLAGAIANLWARGAFPERWGGPNIGGGLLQMMFYVAALSGAVLTAKAAVERRRNRTR
jgi:uncharacterized membrane protein HdeD (DUF308 family)